MFMKNSKAEEVLTTLHKIIFFLPTFSSDLMDQEITSFSREKASRKKIDF